MLKTIFKLALDVVTQSAHICQRHADLGITDSVKRQIFDWRVSDSGEPDA
jgi:hypothetical protein